MAATRLPAEIVERPRGHARVLGAPRSGKTTLLVERFHHLTRTGHCPLVIAFGRDQRDQLLARLWPPGTAVFGPTPVTTHGLLASRLLAAARPSRVRTLRDVDELVVLDRVLGAHPGILRSDLRSIAGSRSFRDALMPVLHVLAQGGVSVDAAQEAAARTADPRARDVLALFAVYRAHLANRGLVTFYNAAWEASRVVAEDRSLATAAGVGDVVLVDDFQDLDAGQFELLRALAPPDGPVAVEVFGDPAGARFSFRGTSDRFLHDAFPHAYRPVDFRLLAPRPADVALGATIDGINAWAGGAAPNHPREKAAPALAALPLFAAATVESVEARFAWNVRARAVRASDEIAEAQHAAASVRAWIDAGVAPADIVLVARDPERIASLVHHIFRERGVPIDVGARADTAIDAFVHALVGALGRDSDSRFAEALGVSALLDPFCAASRESPRHVARLVSTLRAAYSSRGAVDLARLLEERVEPVVSGAVAGVVGGVVEDWRRYAEVVAHAGGELSLDEFRCAYLDGALPEPSDGGDAPRLVSARAASGRHARAAVVLGCADGLFPRVETETGYLSFTALSAALAGINDGASADLAARVDRDAIERAESGLLLSALCAASESLVVSCPTKSGGECLEPASALAPLFEGASDALRDASSAMHAAGSIARCPADDLLSEKVRDLDATASAWLSPGPSAERPHLDAFVLSPSGLDNFTRCARKFFYTRVLRVPEPGSIYLQIGSVFHGVLKRVIPVGASGDEVRALLRSGDFTPAVEETIEEEMPDASGWVRDLTRVHIGLMLRRVAELESERIGRYTVLSVEQSVDFLDDGVPALRGRVDRIDNVEGLGAVVVDYKTGKIPRTAATVLKEIEEDRKHWQVPVYSVLAATLGVTPASFLFYAVPPGDKPHVIGLQTVDGALPTPIPDRGKSRSPYGRLARATVQRALAEAAHMRVTLTRGECAFDRTDRTSECERCHFIHVCRRTQG